MPLAAIISPLYSLSMPDKILRKVDLPEPFIPTIPILAFGKKDKLIFSKSVLPPDQVLDRFSREKIYW